MTPADRQTVARKLGYLRQNLEKLVPYRTQPEKAFVDSIEQYAVERLFQTAIESVIDCARLLVIIEDWRRLRDEREALLILAERAVIDDDLAQRLLQAKKFRNVLVHQYVEVDPHLVYLHLQSGHEELAAFAHALAEWLQAH